VAGSADTPSEGSGGGIFARGGDGGGTVPFGALLTSLIGVAGVAALATFSAKVD